MGLAQGQVQAHERGTDHKTGQHLAFLATALARTSAPLAGTPPGPSCLPAARARWASASRVYAFTRPRSLRRHRAGGARAGDQLSQASRVKDVLTTACDANASSTGRIHCRSMPDNKDELNATVAAWATRLPRREVRGLIAELDGTRVKTSRASATRTTLFEEYNRAPRPHARRLFTMLAYRLFADD